MVKTSLISHFKNILRCLSLSEDVEKCIGKRNTRIYKTLIDEQREFILRWTKNISTKGSLYGKVRPIEGYIESSPDTLYTPKESELSRRRK